MYTNQLVEAISRDKKAVRRPDGGMWERNSFISALCEREICARNNARNIYTGGGFKVCTVVPGDKCNDGGEYGFYEKYIPVWGYDGIYQIITTTTCDFDACGTGWKGFIFLSNQKVEEIQARVPDRPYKP